MSPTTTPPAPDPRRPDTSAFLEQQAAILLDAPDNDTMVRRLLAAALRRISELEQQLAAATSPDQSEAIYWSRAERIYFGASRQDAAAIGFDDVRIYEEVALPVNQRALPAKQLLRQEALESFREWERKPDKIRY